MFYLIAFPWPVASANVPIAAISSRSLPPAQEPTRTLLTAGSSR
jgi:hypothetical protein